MTFLEYPFHPLTVHFPIALYLLGVLMTLLYLWPGQTDLERFAAWSFGLSWLAALVASLTGLIDQNQLELADPRRETVNLHITSAVALIILNGLIVYLRFRWPDVLNRYRWIYLGLMVLGTMAVLTTAWLGGELVYRLGVGVQ
jgi:uncharacterized membrane protein